MASTQIKTATSPAYTAAESWHPKVRQNRTSLKKLQQAENAIRKVVLRHLAAYLQLAVQNFESYGTTSGQDADEVDRESTLFLNSIDAAFDKDAFVKDFRKALVVPLTLGAQLGALDIPRGARIAAESAQDVLLSIDWSLLDPDVVEYLDNSSATLVTNVLETTRNRIRTDLSAGVQQGESRDEIAGRLKNTMNDVPAWRARLIAQTEVIRAHSQGALQSYRASGVVQGKRWVDGQPEACPTCQELNDEVVGLDELFSDGSDSPPSHPGCRCTVAAVLSAQ